MGRIFGILLFVLALWFTGKLVVEARAPDADSRAAVERTQQARDAVLHAKEQGEERRRRLLGD